MVFASDSNGSRIRPPRLLSHSYFLLSLGAVSLDLNARFSFEELIFETLSVKFQDKETVTLTQMISLISACVFMGHLKHTQLASVIIWSVVATGSAVYLSKN